MMALRERSIHRDTRFAVRELIVTPAIGETVTIRGYALFFDAKNSIEVDIILPWRDTSSADADETGS